MHTHTHQSASPKPKSPLHAPPNLSVILRGTGIHPKLKVGAVDDPVEAEADRIANQVMNMSDQQISYLQFNCKGANYEKSEETRQKSVTVDTSNANLPASVNETLLSQGHAFDESTRKYFEPRFGRDLSNIRLYTNSVAQKSAKDIEAKAYAVGNRIVFGCNSYAPQTEEGRRLIAHELAHVVQQSSATEDFGHMLDKSNFPNHSFVSLRQDHGISSEKFGSHADQQISRIPLPRKASSVNFENATMITVELPIDSVAADRLGYEKDFHGYLPKNIVENSERWHASHAVGPGIGVESGEGILLAPVGVNLSVQKNIENHINRIKESLPRDSKLVLKVETRAHAGTRRLAQIIYELRVVSKGDNLTVLGVTVEVSNNINAPAASVRVNDGGVSGNEAVRNFPDANNITKAAPRTSRSTPTETDKAKPLKPKSSLPATYSSTANVTKRYQVSNPIVTMRRPQAIPIVPPKNSPQPQSPAPQMVPTNRPALTSNRLGGLSNTSRVLQLSPSQKVTASVGMPVKKIVDYGNARIATTQAKFQGVAMLLDTAIGQLDEIGKNLQEKEAQTKVINTRREIIDILGKEPGVGAVIELQFIEPEHMFQDVRWLRTTDPNAGRPTVVANAENRRPTSTFIVIEPVVNRKSSASTTAIGPAIQVPKEVKTVEEFVANYIRARGEVFDRSGDIAIEMYDSILKGAQQFGVTDVTVGKEVIRIPDAVRTSVVPSIMQMAEKTTRSRLSRLKRGIDTQQEKLTKRMGDFFGGAIKLTGHELDSARAHFASAENYFKDKKFIAAGDSIHLGVTQVIEVWKSLYYYDNGRQSIVEPDW
jgi:Domain of unknown function (DUF4157)